MGEKKEVEIFQVQDEWEDDFYKTAAVVKLDTLSDVNDIGKPWRYEEDGLTVTRTSPWSPPGCHPVGCGLKLYVNDEGRIVERPTE